MIERLLTGIQRNIEEPRYIATSRDNGLPDGFERIYFYHIRKTGGTSLRYAFLRLGGENADDVFHRMQASRTNRTISGGKVFAQWHAPHFERGNFFYGFSHFPMHKFTLPPHTFTFSILRDPAKRVLSFYRMLLAGHRLSHLAEEGFDAFLESAPRKYLWAHLDMFSSEYDPDDAFENLMACDMYFFTSQFDEGVRELGERLNLPLTVSHARRTNRNAFSPSPEQLAALNQRLEPEYTFYKRAWEAYHP